MQLIQGILAAALLAALGAAGYFYSEATNSELALAKLKTQSQQNLTAEQELQRLKSEMADYKNRVENLSQARSQLEQELSQAIAAGQASVSDDGVDLSINVLGSVLFTPADAHLTSEGTALLKEIANNLRTTDSTIQIIGHTDSWPIAQHLRDRYPSNWELGATRAINVAKYMREALDIAPERIIAGSAAQYRPVADNDSDEGRAANRRIEIRLITQN